jgi:hypothetical protein
MYSNTQGNRTMTKLTPEEKKDRERARQKAYWTGYYARNKERIDAKNSKWSRDHRAYRAKRYADPVIRAKIREYHRKYNAKKRLLKAAKDVLT